LGLPVRFAVSLPPPFILPVSALIISKAYFLGQKVKASECESESESEGKRNGNGNGNGNGDGMRRRGKQNLASVVCNKGKSNGLITIKYKA